MVHCKIHCTNKQEQIILKWISVTWSTLFHGLTFTSMSGLPYLCRCGRASGSLVSLTTRLHPRIQHFFSHELFYARSIFVGSILCLSLKSIKTTFKISIYNYNCIPNIIGKFEDVL